MRMHRLNWCRSRLGRVPLFDTTHISAAELAERIAAKLAPSDTAPAINEALQDITC